MNISKAQLKIGLLHELGNDFDDQREAAERDLYRFEGAITALKAAYEKLDTVRAYYRAEVDEEKLDPDAAQVIMRAIDRCSGVLQNLREHSETQKLVKAGNLDALTKNVKYLKKQMDDEVAKVENLRAVLEDPNASEEEKLAAASGRPPVTDLQKRREEARLRREREANEAAEAEKGEEAKPADTETEPAAEVEAETQKPEPSKGSKGKRQGKRPSSRRLRGKTGAAGG